MSGASADSSTSSSGWVGASDAGAIGAGLNKAVPRSKSGAPLPASAPSGCAPIPIIPSSCSAPACAG
eukprot:2304967-Rhodomonas_salina.1